MEIQVLVVDGDSVELEEGHVVLFDQTWSEPEDEAEMWSEADSLGCGPELDHMLDGMSNRDYSLGIHEGALGSKEFDDRSFKLKPEVEGLALAGEAPKSWDGAEALAHCTMLLHHLNNTENIFTDFDHLIRF